MRLYQFIAIDGSFAGFDVRKIASGIWTEERSTLDEATLASEAESVGKNSAIVTVEVDADVIDWVGTRGFREDDPAKKQVKLYPGVTVALVEVAEV
jgi:hypothetical protein